MDRVTVNRRKVLQLLGGGAGLAVAGALPRGRAGAAPLPQATAAARSGNLMFGKAQEAVGLDPALITAASSFQVTDLAYDQLIQFDEHFQPQPRLAEKWENPDDKTFVFHLRPGVTFHNGRAMTADDVKYSFERIMDPKTNSPWLTQLAPIASIDATDEQTVTFHMKQSYGPFLATVSSDWAAIVPKEDVEKNGDLQKTVDGTGPFKLTEYVQDTRTVFAANTHYWEAGLPRLAQLTYKILPDEPARLAALRAGGSIDMTTLADPASIKTAGTASGIKVITQDTTDYYLLGLNCKRAPFDNVKVRQAISLAVDRQAALQAVFFGEGQVTGPIVPTLGDWATPIADLPYYKPDPAQAKQLLKEANLANGFDMKILTSPQYPEFVSISLVLQQQLKDVGINATLDSVEWGTFIDRWKKRDFDSFCSYNGSGNDPDRALYPAFYTGGSVNAFQFSDPTVDKYLDEGRETVDRAGRKAAYQKAEEAIATAAPAIFLFTRTAHFALRDNVNGFAPNAADTWGTLKDTTIG